MKPIEPAEPLRTLIVAAGRTVQTGNGYLVEYETIGSGGHASTFARQVPTTGKHVFSEGEEVSLPLSEAARLLELGFVIELGSPQPKPLGGGEVAPDGARRVNALTPNDGGIILSAREV